MTYGFNHLLKGGRGLFSGGVSRKILLCRGGGHYIKNKNIVGCVL